MFDNIKCIYSKCNVQRLYVEKCMYMCKRIYKNLYYIFLKLCKYIEVYKYYMHVLNAKNQTAHRVNI